MQVGEYNLYGNVESLGKVRLLNAERDSILLSFRQAKVCLCVMVCVCVCLHVIVCLCAMVSLCVCV